jgi:hypothetical protein
LLTTGHYMVYRRSLESRVLQNPWDFFRGLSIVEVADLLFFKKNYARFGHEDRHGIFLPKVSLQYWIYHNPKYKIPDAHLIKIYIRNILLPTQSSRFPADLLYYNQF